MSGRFVIRGRDWFAGGLVPHWVGRKGDEEALAVMLEHTHLKVKDSTSCVAGSDELEP